MTHSCLNHLFLQADEWAFHIAASLLRHSHTIFPAKPSLMPQCMCSGHGWTGRTPALLRHAHSGGANSGAHISGASSTAGPKHSFSIQGTLTLLAGTSFDSQPASRAEYVAGGGPPTGSSAPPSTGQFKLQQLRQLQQHGMWQHCSPAPNALPGAPQPPCASEQHVAIL